MKNELDAIIQRLQNLQPFNIYAIDGDGNVTPWYEVDGTIVRDIVILEHSLETQVQCVTGRIQHWGRLAAQAKRVWEIEERDYRIWRSRKFLEFSRPPEDEEEAESWKKPTEKTIDAMIRIEPEYRKWYVRQERAEEAYNATTAILDAFRAQRDVLRSAVYRSRENGAPTLGV